MTSWKAQANTEGNATHCNTERDDDGNFFLYQQDHNNNPADAMACAGLNFSSFDDSGSDLDIYVPYTYDAVYVLAHALHDVIVDQALDPPFSNQTTEAETFGDALFEALIDISYTGITGTIEFSEGTGTDQHGRGDREVGVKYDVKNFNTGEFVDQDSSAGLVTVGSWDPTDEMQVCSSTDDTDCFTIQYSTNDNSVPSDEPDYKLFELGPRLAAFIIFLGTLLCALALACYYMLIAYHQERIIMLSQPYLCYVIITGGFVGGLDGIIHAFHPSEVIILFQFSFQFSFL